MGASPVAGHGEGLESTVRCRDVFDRVTIVTFCPARVIGHHKVGTVKVGGFGVDKITVKVGGCAETVVGVDAWTSKEGLESLLAVGVSVKNRDRSAVCRRVCSAVWKGNVGKEGKAVIVGYETTGFLGSSDSDRCANRSEGRWVDLLDVDISLTVIKIGKVSGGSVSGEGEGCSAVVGQTGPVGGLDRVEAE